MKFNPLLVTFVTLVIMSSCVTQRKVEYLQDRNKNSKTFKEAEFSDYRLKPNDELYIQINSLDEAAANVFSNSREESIYLGSIQLYGASLMSYSIDKDGYLLLPVIGKILVKDKTISEVSNILKDSLNHILNQPIVKVKLVNKYVSVLGEVKNPGNFAYSQDKLTIYDALGLAGDITDYGNRNKVILIRNINGENIRINMDITKSDILSSDYYNLRPNDIIYVKPLRNKFWGMRQFPFEILFSALTTALLFYSIFK
ncbi:MAG: polysaccharide biosynthesis/export family protein [Bacteroidales bacterium]|jgi:polysaccharide export outer membrane protein